MKIPLRNFASISGMRVFTAILSFLFFVFLTRYWDRSTLGAFTTIWALSLLLQQISLLGLHIPVTRDMVQRPDDLPRLAVGITAIALVVAIVLGLGLGTVGGSMYPDEMHTALWLVGLSFIPTTIMSVSDTVLLAQERLHVTGLVNGLEALFRTVVSVILVRLGYGLTAVFAVLLLSRVLAALAYLYLGGIGTILRPRERAMPTVRRLLPLIPIFAGIIILQSGFTRIDFVILSKLGSLTQVGMYSAPYKLFEAALTIPTIATIVLFPMLARWYAQSAPRFEQLTREAIRCALTVGLPAAVVLAFVARPLLVGLFGPAFAPAAPVLVWLAAVPVIAAIDITLAGVLHTSHHQNLDLRAMAVAFAFYVTALVVLIPQIGYVGAAAATAAAEIVQTVIRYNIVRRVVRFRSMLEVMARPIAAGIIMVAVLAAAQAFPLVLSLPVALIGYAVSVAAFGAVTRDDVRRLRGALLPEKQWV